MSYILDRKNDLHSLLTSKKKFESHDCEERFKRVFAGLPIYWKLKCEYVPLNENQLLVRDFTQSSYLSMEANSHVLYFLSCSKIGGLTGLYYNLPFMQEQIWIGITR